MITHSEIVRSTIQTDGRRSVREKHTDESGEVFYIEYFASKDTDIQIKLTVHAASLNVVEEQVENDSSY